MPSTSSPWISLTSGDTGVVLLVLCAVVGVTLGCTSDGSTAVAVSRFPALCRLVDEIVWVKMTVNRRLAKSHGYYLQHAKEVCLVGKKGSDPCGIRHSVGSDIIYSERRGQSQKPEEIYQLMEELVPNGNQTTSSQQRQLAVCFSIVLTETAWHHAHPASTMLQCMWRGGIS